MRPPQGLLGRYPQEIHNPSQRHVQAIAKSEGSRSSPRSPTTWLGAGVVEFDKDFHGIGQCRLARPGESWRQVRSEASRLPFQE